MKAAPSRAATDLHVVAVLVSDLASMKGRSVRAATYCVRRRRAPRLAASTKGSSIGSYDIDNLLRRLSDDTASMKCSCDDQRRVADAVERQASMKRRLRRELRTNVAPHVAGSRLLASMKGGSVGSCDPTLHCSASRAPCLNEGQLRWELRASGRRAGAPRTGCRLNEGSCGTDHPVDSPALTTRPQ